MTDWHIAQLNVARASDALDSPALEPFLQDLARINALADAAPGFRWRLQGDSDSAAAAVGEHDPRLIVNMSVWQSPDALFDYVYRSGHVRAMARFRPLFERPTQAVLVLWWLPAAHLPSLDEGLARLERLRKSGPTADAFTFKRRYPAPGEDGAVRDMKTERYCSGWR